MMLIENIPPLQLVTELDIAAVEPSELELVTPTSNAIYNSNCDCDFPLKGEEETVHKQIVQQVKNQTTIKLHIELVRDNNKQQKSK